MATPEQVAQAYYAGQKQITTTAVRGAVAQWDTLDSSRLSESWLARIGQLILALITGAQQRAAEQANPYLADMAVAQGVSLPAPASVVAGALAGVASDGRDLASLLYLPIIFTKQWLAQGRPLPEAMAHGRGALALLASTQVADAGRAAVSVGMTANKTWVSYVRHVTLPACSRCIILAGREYSYSTGFQRHPNCDCTMIPRIHHADGSVGGPDPASPRELFDQMTLEDQTRLFGKAGAEAIRDGADLGQVVNARRGMQTAGGRLVTTEGTSRRGFAGRRMGSQTGRRSPVRPMPEQIYADAGGDRDEAIRLLERFGYIQGQPRRTSQPRPEPQQTPEAAPAPEQPPTEAAPRWEPSPRMTPQEASRMQQDMLDPAPWTAGQREALLEYTGGWAAQVNNLLRNGEGSDDETTRRFTRDVGDAMRPLPRSTTVYRYVAQDAFGVADVAQLPDLVGRTLQDRGFLSTTLAPTGHTDAADQMWFASRRPVLMEIDVPAGTPVAYVDDLSAHQGQWELILDAGVPYRVVEVVADGTHTVVRVQVTS